MNESYINKVRSDLYKVADVHRMAKQKRNKIKMKIDNFKPKHKLHLSQKQVKEIKNKCKKTKKQKIEISYSSSTNDDTSDVEQIHGTSKRKKRKLDEEQDNSFCTDFNLNQFFSTREQSFNESVIESHSGIDYEFLSNDIDNVKFCSRKISENSEENSQEYSIKTEEYLENCKSDLNEVTNTSSDNNEEIQEDKNSQKTLSLEKTIINISSSEEEVSSEEKEVFGGEDLIVKCDMEQVDIRQEKRQKWKVIDLEHQKLVIIYKNNSVSCYGLCSLKVLYGKLEILGYHLTKKSGEVKIYSPRGSSLLVAKNITDREEEDDLEGIQKCLKHKEALKNLKIEKTSVVFICSTLETSKFMFLEKYISEQIFPKISSPKMPRLIFEPKDKFNTVKVNPKWDEILQTVTPSKKLLIAGGKGVGKSTFVRYSINKLLSRFEKIRVIDLDPGQSEFTIPGCISIITVSEPVFGPSYTHLKKTDRSYLTNINVGREPIKYIQCIKMLMESLDETEEFPTLINYIGFTHGLGLHIISSAITYIRPTEVVQIDSKSSRQNFKSDVTPKLVEDYCCLFGGDFNDLHFTLFKIYAMTDNNDRWSLKPKQVREMSVLTYFGELQADSMTSHTLPMHVVKLSSIKIEDEQGQSICPAVINANLVALCSRRNKALFNVLGYGIVRGVDPQSNRLILITPEPINVLEKVFYLVLTSVSLPPSVYMTAFSITESIPYVMEGELESLGQITRRSYIPSNKK